MPISPITTLVACQQADASLRRFLRQHGQRVARPAPTPSNALACLEEMTGADAAACQDAITLADALGLVVDMGEGRAHLTTKGRRIAASPLQTWGRRCGASGRLVNQAYE
jgi:hypothetical protein